MARPIIMRSGIRCARYEWQNPPFKRWSQTCNMVCRLEYSIWLCALRARMPPGYIYRHKIPILFDITTNHIWCGLCIRESSYRWGNDKWPAKSTLSTFGKGGAESVATESARSSLSPFLQYISDTQNKFFHFLQPIKQSNKQHVESTFQKVEPKTKYMYLITDEERN